MKPRGKFMIAVRIILFLVVIFIFGSFAYEEIHLSGYRDGFSAGRKVCIEILAKKSAEQEKCEEESTP